MDGHRSTASEEGNLYERSFADKGKEEEENGNTYDFPALTVLSYIPQPHTEILPNRLQIVINCSVNAICSYWCSRCHIHKWLVERLDARLLIRSDLHGISFLRNTVPYTCHHTARPEQVPSASDLLGLDLHLVHRYMCIDGYVSSCRFGMGESCQAIVRIIRPAGFAWARVDKVGNVAFTKPGSIAIMTLRTVVI